MQKIENAVKKEKKVFNHIFIHCRIMSEISEIFKFFIEGVCTSLLGISGIIGNVVSIAVLSSSELDMMPSFRHLLKMLAAFDATFLIFTLALFGISPWSSHYDQFIKPWLIPYFLPIIQVKSNFRTKNHFWELRRRKGACLETDEKSFTYVIVQVFTISFLMETHSFLWHIVSLAPLRLLQVSNYF